MSERRIDSYFSLYEKTMRPKIEISAPQEISSIVVALDETPKSEKALSEAIELARRYDAKLKVISVMEYFRAIEQFIDLSSYGIEKQVKKIDMKLAEEEGLDFSHEQALGPKPSELAKELRELLRETGSPIEQLLRSLTETRPHLMVIPVPFLERSGEVASNSLGVYIDTLLRRAPRGTPVLLIGNSELKGDRSKFLLLVRPDDVQIVSGSALDFYAEGMELFILGIIDQSIIDALDMALQSSAEKELDEEELDEIEVDSTLTAVRLEENLKTVLESLDFSPVDENIKVNIDVQQGVSSFILRSYVEENDIGLVIVKARPTEADAMDGETEILIRRLTEVVPVLVIWD
ncbi:MAG: universal stress protein [Candidatus Kariarchaeaceae archaeon]